MAGVKNFISSVILLSSTFYLSVVSADDFGFGLALSSYDVNRLSASELAEYYLDRADSLDKYDDCKRTCVSGENRLCYYEFILELYATLTPVCGNCSSGVLEDCFADQCVPADGVGGGFMSINRKLPGPAIEVCKNDLIVVRMINRMARTAVTIHWLGIKQTGTPYMDGVPYFTQCPVPEANSFLYSFYAEDSGTYSYHSHTGHQLTNGLVSSLIIRDVPAEDPHYDLYDVDNHTMFLNDWAHTYNEMFDPGLINTTAGIGVHDSILINGHGVYFDNNNNETTKTPYATFHVKSGLRYRFRAIGGVGLICPVRIQIENHTMTMIAADGTNIQPVEVNSFIIYPGEKYDFILTANQTSANYWIHAKGTGICDFFPILYQTAVLAYDQTSTALGLIPATAKPTSSGYNVGIILNDQTSYCNNSISICPSQLQSLSVDTITLWDEPEYIIPLSFMRITTLTKTEIFSKNWTDWISFSVITGGKLSADVINGIQSEFQPSPYMTQPDDIDWKLTCNKDNMPASCAGKNVCRCDHGMAVELNSVVHVLLINNDTISADPISHPVHLHGHKFYVLKSGHFDNTTTIETIQNLSLKELLEDNPSPVLKDTVGLPSYGYVIIRFIANNPGFWLMHCHIEPHINVGMMVGWQVGTYEDFPSPPANFPKCGNFGNSPR